MRLRNVALTLLLASLVISVGCKKEQKPVRTAAVKKAAAPWTPIAAENYQSEILSIDKLVFRDEPLDMSLRQLLVAEMTSLAGRAELTGASRELTVRVNGLRALSERVRSGAFDASPQLLQSEWMSTRSSLFGEREWFAGNRQQLESLRNQQMFGDSPSAVGEGGVAPSPTAGFSAAAPRFELPGRWVVSEQLVNGQPSSDPNIVGSLWSFDDDGLKVDRGTYAGGYSVIDYIDSRGTAMMLDPTDGGPSGWMLYQFTPTGKLMVALSTEMSERPSGFVAAAPAVITTTAGTTIGTGSGSTGDGLIVLTLDPVQ